MNLPHKRLFFSMFVSMCCISMYLGRVEASEAPVQQMQHDTASELKPTIPPSSNVSDRRFAGALLGTFVGLGTGHAVLGAWQESGKMFTYLESAYLAWSAAAVLDVRGDWPENSPPWLNNMLASVSVTGILTAIPALIGMRIAETVDSWTHPLADKYQISSDRPELTPPQHTKMHNAAGISPKTYRLGGLIGTTVGFGLGHVVSGIYGVPSALYGLGELGGLGLIVWGITEALSDNPSEFLPGFGQMALGFAIFGITRIVEVADIWLRPKVNWKRSSSSPIKHAILVPWINTQSGGLNLAFRF